MRLQEHRRGQVSVFKTKFKHSPIEVISAISQGRQGRVIDMLQRDGAVQRSTNDQRMTAA